MIAEIYFSDRSSRDAELDQALWLLRELVGHRLSDATDSILKKSKYSVVLTTSNRMQIYLVECCGNDYHRAFHMLDARTKIGQFYGLSIYQCPCYKDDPNEAVDKGDDSSYMLMCPHEFAAEYAILTKTVLVRISYQQYKMMK